MSVEGGGLGIACSWPVGGHPSLGACPLHHKIAWIEVTMPAESH